MRKKHWIPILLGICLASSAIASGSYGARPPRVPTGESQGGGKIDNQKYALGKNIYSGKAKLPAAAGADRTAQEPKLRELQSRLPVHTQMEVNLTQYAGRLSAAELEALEYYVTRRYPSK